MNRFDQLINQIFFERRFGLILEIISDRILFHLFYWHYYRKKFAYYGMNIRWGKHGQFVILPKS